jgi:hypothetical protein
MPPRRRTAIFVGIDLIVLRFAPMDGFHVEGMAEDEGNPLLGAKIGRPVPREEAFDADDEIFPVGRHGLEKWFGSCLHIPVQHNLTVLIQDAEVHTAGVQVDATVKGVLVGVESHEVSSSVVSSFFPKASIPLGYAMGETLIIIKALQRTGRQRRFAVEWFKRCSLVVPPPPLSYCVRRHSSIKRCCRSDMLLKRWYLGRMI